MCAAGARTNFLQYSFDILIYTKNNIHVVLLLKDPKLDILLLLKDPKLDSRPAWPLNFSIQSTV